MAPLVVQRLMHEPVPVPCSFSQVATTLSATHMFMHCLFHVAHACEPVHCKSSPQATMVALACPHMHPYMTGFAPTLQQPSLIMETQIRKSVEIYADYKWIAIPEFLVQEHQGESYIKMRATSQPIIKLVAGSRLQDFQECIHEVVR